jgi:hypothetical protein
MVVVAPFLLDFRSTQVGGGWFLATSTDPVKRGILAVRCCWQPLAERPDMLERQRSI